jgi:M6 family metalloprotease-like protein
MPKKIKISCLLFSLVFAGLCTHTNLAAAPPHPELLEELRERGDIAGLARIQARMAEKEKLGVNRIASPAPSQGNVRVLVLLIDYPDRAFRAGSTPTFYSNLLNGVNTSALSMRRYFADMSGGKLNLQIDVRGPYRASQNVAYYGANSTSTDFDVRPGHLVREAVIAARNAGVDFTPYDNRGTGNVDVVMVIAAGRGEEVSNAPNDIWSHAWTLQGSGAGTVTANGKVVNVYSIQPEFIRNPGDSTIGVFCHEFAHILGLPDLYDTEYETNGVGIFSLMAAGTWAGQNGSHPTPLLAWEKNRLGWITTKVPSAQAMSPHAFLRSSPSALPLSVSAGQATAAAPPLFYAIFAFGLFGLGGGCVWYRRRGGRIASFVTIFVFLLASAFFVVSCGDFFDWLLSDDPPHSNDPPPPGPGQISLGDIETARETIIIPLGDPDGQQYYFLENKVRRNGTWTQFLPGDGLLITHVHNGVIAATINRNEVNDGAARIHGVTVVEADNGNDLWARRNMGTASDLFRSRNFTPSTSPRTFYYTGTSPSWDRTDTALSKVYIESISAAGATMTFRYSVR